MNWRIEATAKKLGTTKPDVAHADDEDGTEPTAALLKAARTAAASLAKTLGGEVSVTIDGHETTTGKGFRPAHVAITVSRLDPDRDEG